MQGVGLYNNLLNGEASPEVNDDGEDAEGFSESNLYSVNSLGYCEIVEKASDVEDGTAENIKVENNIVYCRSIEDENKWNITPYSYYGEVISSPYVHAETSVYANLLFFLKGPFYAEQTTVTIRFDETEIGITQYPESLEYDSSCAVTTPNAPSLFKEVHNGDAFIVKNRNYYKPIKLRVYRKDLTVSTVDGNDATEPFTADIVFDNGTGNDKHVYVRFCEVVLLYRNGVGYNGFDPNNVEVTNPAHTYLNVTNVVNGSGSGYLHFLWSKANKAWAWLYKRDASRQENDRFYIDYSKGVKLYIRVLKCSYNASNQFRTLHLGQKPGDSATGKGALEDWNNLFPNYIPNYYQEYFPNDVKDNEQMYYKDWAIRSLGNNLTRWPSIDGVVLSIVFPYGGRIEPYARRLEKDIAFGGVIRNTGLGIHIAEIGIMKLSNFEIDGWEL